VRRFAPAPGGGHRSAGRLPVSKALVSVGWQARFPTDTNEFQPVRVVPTIGCHWVPMGVSIDTPNSTFWHPIPTSANLRKLPQTYRGGDGRNTEFCGRLVLSAPIGYLAQGGIITNTTR
jgi:hypothetical protein